MNKRPLYFDYAATTPVDERVIQVMVQCLGFDGNFGNPASSSHAFGQEARRAVEQARRQVAQLVGAQAGHIVWTSGATESNNLAIKGVAQALGVRKGHLVTSLIEHKAVLDTVKQLEEGGVAVTWLAPDADGLISPQAVREALREDTFLVSLMVVNN
jgi:cysteine desulfurase